jgi:hypothetical protein
MTRSITDILWTGSARVRGWRGGDVRAVYYTVLTAVVVWGIIALKLAAPVMLLQIGANIAGVVFVFASMHLLYLNTRVLPVALRLPVAPRGAGRYGAVLRVLRRCGSVSLKTLALAADLDAVATWISTESMSPRARAHGRHRRAAARFPGTGCRLRRDAAQAELGVHSSKHGR